MVKTEEGVVVWPAEVLDAPGRPVTEFGAPLEALLADMDRIMRASEGIGIAANQIGVGLRVALVGREDGTFFEIVNPEVLERTGPVTMNEGCLSVPDEREDVPRYRRVKVRFQDKSGAWQELEAEGRLAHVLQHEIDHLDGTVYVKKLSLLKKGLIRKRMLKIQRILEK